MMSKFWQIVDGRIDGDFEQVTNNGAYDHERRLEKTLALKLLPQCLKSLKRQALLILKFRECLKIDDKVEPL